MCLTCAQVVAATPLGCSFFFTLRLIVGALWRAICVTTVSAATTRTNAVRHLLPPPPPPHDDDESERRAAPSIQRTGGFELASLPPLAPLSQSFQVASRAATSFDCATRGHRRASRWRHPPSFPRTDGSSCCPRPRQVARRACRVSALSLAAHCYSSGG